MRSPGTETGLRGARSGSSAVEMGREASLGGVADGVADGLAVADSVALRRRGGAAGGGGRHRALEAVTRERNAVTSRPARVQLWTSLFTESLGSRSRAVLRGAIAPAGCSHLQKASRITEQLFLLCFRAIL